MILKNNVAPSVFFWVFLKGVYGASFSNVFVQSQPVEYFKYGTPTASFAVPEIAQISTGPGKPLELVQGLVSPCVAPCVIPGASIAAVAPQARANIVTYKSTAPNVPIVFANKDDAASYQYSYAVYDENTGDHKSQSEHSDGSVVQGQYSLIEPNGSRREVTYTADDLKGFNAVVRNFSPKTKVISNEANEPDKKESTPPCNEVKSEQIKEEPKKEKEVEEGPKEEVESASHEETTERVETPIEDLKVEEITTEQPEKVKENPKEETPDLQENNGVVSYSDIIKCLQAKLHGTRIENYSNPSPLTYILLPTLGNKPC